MSPQKASARDIPGLFYAGAIVEALLRDYHQADKAQKPALEAELLDFGRMLLNVAAPLAVKAGYGQAPFEQLYKRCQSILAPHWERHDANFPTTPDKSGLILDVCYETQRQLRELAPKARRNGERRVA